MYIGQKIKALRFDKNLSQKEFADSIGMSEDMILLYEKNRKPISEKALKKICDIYQVTPEYFLQEKLQEIQGSSVSEKAFEELKVQLEFLRRTLERMSEENSNLVKIISSNFQEGSSLSVSPENGEDTALMAA